jgi:transposase
LYYDARALDIRSVSVRGDDQQTAHLFSYVSPEQRVPSDHPLRVIRQITDVALTALTADFDAIYSDIGRPSVPPEKLLRALVIQALYSIRSERLLMEQLEYNLLFRWFVGLDIDDAVWTPTTFTKNRDRLLGGDIARRFFEAVLAQAQQARLLSDEHFTVDGTLLEAWASLKSFRRKDGPSAPPSDDPGNPTVNFHGERRSNETHASTTDPDSRLFRKSKGHEAKLAYMGEVLMENRHGLVVDAAAAPATGLAERELALGMLERVGHRATVGGDKGYNNRPFVDGARRLGITPHVAEKAAYNAIDRRTTRHPGYTVSGVVRKRVEEIFGWMKTVGMLRKLRHRGTPRVAWAFLFGATVFNLVRMRTLLARPA